MKAVIIVGLVIVCGAVVSAGVVFFILPLLEKDDRPVEIRVAQEKCDEYVKVACSSPIPSGVMPPGDLHPITGRKLAAEGTHPHMARLTWLFNGPVNPMDPDPFATCGATLISEHFVMTSAFCAYVMRERKEGDIILTIGSVNIDNIALAENYTIGEIIIHDNFHKNLDNVSEIDAPTPYDIALLKLNRSVTFTWSKRPICLNTNYESIDDKHFTFTGFGVLLDKSSRLKLQILDQYTDKQVQSNCSSKLNDSVVSNMICARHPDDNRALCPYDMGGALQIPLKKKGACANTYEQVGIGSLPFSSNCLSNSTYSPFALYTKVDKYIYWIVSHVWPDKLKEMQK